MAKPQSVVNLDPIDRKSRQQGIISKLLISRWYGGKSVLKTDAFGHYMFCGPQRSGKTASVVWYAEFLIKRYNKRRISYVSHELCNHQSGIIKCINNRFKTPPKLKIYSNFGLGIHFDKNKLADIIDNLSPYKNEVRIFLIDEVHTYFPKEGVDKETKHMINRLNAIFSQLGKRNTYILSTAQIYGRLDKALREQCLYMVDCRVNYRGKIINDFIAQEDIIADDLGRWAGYISQRKIHGLSKVNYDNKLLITK